MIRTSNELLDKAHKHPSAKYLCMQDLNPLRQTGSALRFVDYAAIQSIVGEPFAKSEKDTISTFDSKSRRPALVFLGFDLETSHQATQSTEPMSVDLDKTYNGVPYFALDVTNQDTSEILSSASEASFAPTRVDLTLSYPQSSIYAQARSYLDWHAHSRFCSSCGSPTLAIHGGTKIICPPSDAASSTPRKNCPARVGLHNTAFARTDPTLITAPVSADQKRVLLGRGKRWPENYWSCISGFIEPAESMETATRREVWEESGVRVGDVVIHSSQAWPYPSTMLVGTVGLCEKEADEKVSYPEKELGEARWFELDEVEKALDKGHAMWEPVPEGWTGIRLPPDKLMAHRTLRGVLKLFKRR